MARVLTPTLLMALLIASGAANAQQMYRWVDEKGKVHYGDTIPPEYANRGNQQLNKSGRVVKKTDAALTPEQIKARDDAEAKAKQEKLDELERQRHDKALLASYTTVGEIDLSEKRNLGQLDVRAQSIELRQKSVQTKLDELKEREAGFAPRGKPVPPYLAEQIKQAQSELMHLQDSLKEVDKDKAAIRARFAADRARFRELKGLPAEGAGPVAPAAPTSPVVPTPAAPKAPVKK